MIGNGYSSRSKIRRQLQFFRLDEDQTDEQAQQQVDVIDRLLLQIDQYMSQINSVKFCLIFM